MQEGRPTTRIAVVDLHLTVEDENVFPNGSDALFWLIPMIVDRCWLEVVGGPRAELCAALGMCSPICFLL